LTTASRFDKYSEQILKLIIRIIVDCTTDHFLVGCVSGYGHITPRTDGGRLVTMLYAIFGIPLTLYALTNLGFIMATAFRFLYKYICCGLCCLCCLNTESSTITTDDTVGEPGGAAHRAVLFLRGRSHRPHVDVTESRLTATEVKTVGWRQRLDALFAETVDINQVIIKSLNGLNLAESLSLTRLAA